jgi:hypothetical protein
MRVEAARYRKESHHARLLSTQNHSNRVESSNSSVLAETRLRQMTNLLDTFMLSTLFGYSEATENSVSPPQKKRQILVGSGKKKPTQEWARNTGSNVSNVVLNT